MKEDYEILEAANGVEAAAILKGGSIGNGYFDMSVYPSSTPISLAITKNGTAATLMEITPPSIRWLLIMVKLQYLPLVAVLRSASLLRIAVCQIAPLPALLVPAPKERLFSLRYVGDASHTLHYVRS